MKNLANVVIVICVIVALLTSKEAISQTTPEKAWQLTLAINAGLPTGVATEGSTFIGGGDIGLQYGLTQKIALTFRTGGYHFFPKLIPGTNIRRGSSGLGPIKIGGRYFFNEHIYLGAEVGVGYEVTEEGFTPGQHKLILAPSIGWANKRWDTSFRYEDFSGQNNNYGMVAVRIGYGIKLSK